MSIPAVCQALADGSPATSKVVALPRQNCSRIMTVASLELLPPREPGGGREGTGFGRAAFADAAHEIGLKAAETDATKRALATQTEAAPALGRMTWLGSSAPHHEGVQVRGKSPERKRRIGGGRMRRCRR
jgi:hypothetical protein